MFIVQDSGEDQVVGYYDGQEAKKLPSLYFTLVNDMQACKTTW